MGAFDFLDDLFGSFDEVLGWTWEKVISGIFTWFAKGVLILMEWVFTQFDAATTPRVTDDWFANGLVRQVALVGLGITIAMMLISAVSMGWAGRPELFGDALRNGAKSILGAAVAVVLIDAALQVGDGLSATIWAAGRGDVLSLMDGTASAITVGAEVIGLTFLGPFLILMGLVGFLLITAVLFFRSVMIYLVAAFAPIPLALSTGQSFRGATRRLVSLTLALVLAKPAIVLTVVVGAKLTANAGTDAGVTEGLGALVTGFLVFLVAAFAPMVVFKLLPMVGDATMTSGVLAGMGRSAMTVAQAGLIASSAGTALGASAATRSVAGQSAAGGGAGSSGGTGGGTSAGAPSSGGNSLAALPIAGSSSGAGLAGAAPPPSGGGGSASGSVPGMSSGLSAANQLSSSSGGDDSQSHDSPPDNGRPDAGPASGSEGGQR